MASEAQPYAAKVDVTITLTDKTQQTLTYWSEGDRGGGLKVEVEPFAEQDTGEALRAMLMDTRPRSAWPAVYEHKVIVRGFTHYVARVPPPDAPRSGLVAAALAWARRRPR